MSLPLEIVSTILVGVGFLLTIVVFHSNSWEQTDSDSQFTDSNTKTRGIWEECMNYANSGTSTCSTYSSFFLGLPIHLQAARAFIITSLVTGFLATILLTLAISVCPCTSGDKEARNRTRIAGGVFGIITGCCVLSGVSWYAVAVMNEFYTALVISPNVERLVFGDAIFVGWSAGAAAVLGGLLGVCISCGRSDLDETKQDHKLGYYKPPQTQEYV